MTRADRLANWGWQRVKAGKPAEAIDALREAAALSGSAPAHLKALAVAQAKATHVSDSVDTLQRLIKVAPLDIEAWCMLGELSLDRGDLATAARALGLCMQLDPQKTHPSGLRARALIKRAEKFLKKRV